MNRLEERRWYQAYPSDINKFIDIPEIPVYSLLNETAEKYGKRAAIIQDDEEISYGELLEKTERLAGAWNAIGLKKGDRIGLMISNHPDYIISYYAAMRLGLIVVQINPRYTARELLQIVKDSEATYIVAEEDSVDTVNQLKEIYSFEHVYIVGKGTNQYQSINKLIEKSIRLSKDVFIQPKDDIAVIQYTGGTSGVLKGAMLTHYNLVANVYQSYAMYGSRMEFGKEIILTATPLYHVYAMTSAMNLGIYIGATILLIHKFEVENVLEKIKKYQPTFFPGVPRMYNAFVNHKNVEQYGINSLKFCSSGSAPLPIEVIRKFEKITGAVIGEGFGLSEASPSTHRNPPGGIRKVGSIGVPFPNTDCKIVGEDNLELPIGTVGELIIKGPQVMKGYFRNDDETKYALRNGWLYTGDLAKQDEDGYFYIVGRKKEMVINGGFNVYPQEIENVLYEHPDIKECAVVGIPHPEKGEIVKAYLAPKDGVTIDFEEVKGFCYRNLTPYKVPKAFEIIDELPRNTVGKILKRILVEKETEKL
ncbi:long-chain-fatty-acid--CoA ligase [Oceanobacillus bengalensis]|uniref:Long-chain fatty acid--CoA ligase n=1 Tax=Oceanobacillus bengalensis TaxID=1435466 RepID=A0A494Z2J0_9BACI|nr:long-chain fatty acid--CoA ligase [Oceanobacillus bengalensis]RKQ16646.1 long-chain fatty acid--CoA ligase [Oceanobacillus bengalensis]